MTAVGTGLPEWDLPVTATLVVSTALATRDFQDVHHDRELAVERGSKDIFLNILTTTGLVQRYVGDWAREAMAPDFVVRSCSLRLGAPAHPHDTVRFSGVVSNVEDGRVTVDVVGTVLTTGPTNGLDHVTSQVVVSTGSTTGGGSTTVGGETTTGAPA
jgi:hypothetical protein